LSDCGILSLTWICVPFLIAEIIGLEPVAMPRWNRDLQFLKLFFGFVVSIS
jgi:hypothetical protein